MQKKWACTERVWSDHITSSVTGQIAKKKKSYLFIEISYVYPFVVWLEKWILKISPVYLQALFLQNVWIWNTEYLVCRHHNPCYRKLLGKFVYVNFISRCFIKLEPFVMTRLIWNSAAESSIGAEVYILNILLALFPQ